MTKKAFLIQILTALQDDWAPAGGYRILVEQDALDDNAIGALITIFETMVKEEKESVLQAKFATTAVALQKLHELEAASKLDDEQACASLESLIQTI